MGYPTLYQINTRIWLGELSKRLGQRCTLCQVPDEELDLIVRLGFDWVWLLGIWQTGAEGRKISRDNPVWRQEFQSYLPDLTDEDITGSPFAIQSYTVHGDFGGNDALCQLRERLQRRGLKLMLDFVPNHTAPDHAWAWENPEFYIQGSEADLAREPANYCRRNTFHGPRIFAHGRDPYFPGWPDTLQLNYRHPVLRTAMIEELLRAANMCDGLRCDMAMLLLPDVIARTWGDRSKPSDGIPPCDTPFWPEAIARVRQSHPHLLFLAEAYWDLEWPLQQQGFDFTYDKRLYDRLHARDVEAVRGHLFADMDFQKKSARFLENHDEPRAAGAFPSMVHKAAAVVTYLVPGMRFFHEGQLDGRKVRLSMHLGRRLQETPDPAIQDFYHRLLPCLKRKDTLEGRWRLLDCRRAWDNNPTWKQFLAFLWDLDGASRLVVVVNYGGNQGQCYLPLPCANLRGRKFALRDLLSPARYDRDGTELVTQGLYLDMPAWGYHVFEVAEP